MKIIRFFTYLSFVLLFSGCMTDMHSHNIIDVTESETIILEKQTEQGFVHSLIIIGTGKLDGEAEIVMILNGKPYTTEYLSGDVDFSWGGDWYSDQVEIRYTAVSVTGGNLMLKYEFHD